MFVLVRACMRACVRACVRECSMLLSLPTPPRPLTAALHRHCAAAHAALCGHCCTRCAVWACAARAALCGHVQHALRCEACSAAEHPRTAAAPPRPRLTKNRPSLAYFSSLPSFCTAPGGVGSSGWDAGAALAP